MSENKWRYEIPKPVKEVLPAPEGFTWHNAPCPNCGNPMTPEPTEGELIEHGDLHAETCFCCGAELVFKVTVFMALQVEMLQDQPANVKWENEDSNRYRLYKVG